MKSASNVCTLWLARHGDSTGRADDRYGGAADFPLSARGREQAIELRSQATLHDLTLILSSPQRRARQTAEAVVADRPETEVRLIDDLREWNTYGVLSGLTRDEATALFPSVMGQAGHSPEETKVLLLGSEPRAEFHGRVRRAFRKVLEFAAANAGRRPLVVAHGKFLEELVTNVLRASGTMSYQPVALHQLEYRNASYALHRSIPQMDPFKERNDMHIYLLRHGEAQDDIVDAYGGAADHPLTPRGGEQALELGRKLRGCGIERIYTSPLRRAAATSDIVAQELGVTGQVRIIDALRERNSYGVLSGIPKAEACELFPLILNPGQVRSGYDKTPLLGAEDFDDFLVRVAAGFEEVVNSAQQDGLRTIALASHGTFLKALVTEYLALKLPEDWKHGSALLLEYQPATAALARV